MLGAFAGEVICFGKGLGALSGGPKILCFKYLRSLRVSPQEAKASQPKLHRYGIRFDACQKVTKASIEW